MKKIFLIILCSITTLTGCLQQEISVENKIAISKDSERIAYTVYGQNKKALVFIHGWSCDSRYWQKQVSYFSKKYKVITIDLAGHGNSSVTRNNYTMKAFAQDIKAVIEKEKINQAILIGHSMGGLIIAEAARLMPDKIHALIAVDTLQDVAKKLPKTVMDQMTTPFNEDFKTAAQNFVISMFPKDASADIVHWVKEDMSSAPSEIALSAFRNYLTRYFEGSVAPVFKEIDIPLYCINARLWPTNPEENKKHIKDYTLVYIENTGHFPMMENPEEFNAILKTTIEKIETKKNKN